MSVLGIIACGMLEDELAHVLCSDSGVRHLLLIDSPEILGLARKLRSRNRSHLVVSPEAVPDLLADIMKGRSSGFLTRFMNNMDKIGLAFFGQGQQARGEELVVVVSLLKKALHSDEKLLREEVYRSIVDQASFSDGISALFRAVRKCAGRYPGGFQASALPAAFSGRRRREEDRRLYRRYLWREQRVRRSA